MHGPLLADLVAADLVDRLHEMAHDVELVEHQHRLGGADPDDIDVGLPHIAADAFERRGALGVEEIEERSSVSSSLRPSPLHTSRFRARSYTLVTYTCPFFREISSMPICVTPVRSRCAKPYATAAFTARSTVPQAHRNSVATLTIRLWAGPIRLLGRLGRPAIWVR